MAYEAYCMKELGFTTRQLHAGYNPAAHYRSKAVPVYQTAVFELGDYDRCLRLFEYAEEGHSYVRFSNPTNEVLEKRITALEGGTAAVAMASGMAAISNTILNLCEPGDEIIAVSTLYGGSTTLISSLLPRYGIRGRIVRDENDMESYRELINDRTKCIYIESVGNPGINILPMDEIVELAHANGIPVVIDNTFCTPYLFRPFEHGIDIVCYSATKYLAGHGIMIGGLVVENGQFNFRNGRFPQFEAFYEENVSLIGEEILAREMFTKRLRMVFLTELGAHMSPQNAFYLLQGMETLSLRMERHVQNARRIAEFLDSHPGISQVAYPGLPGSPYHELEQKYFPKGCGAMMSVRVAGGLEDAKRVLGRVKVFDYMVNVGDAKSLIVHPASSTHFSQSREAREKAGVYDNTLRLSIGIEDCEDLIADLKQALEV